MCRFSLIFATSSETISTFIFTHENFSLFFIIIFHLYILLFKHCVSFSYLQTTFSSSRVTPTLFFRWWRLAVWWMWWMQCSFSSTPLIILWCSDYTFQHSSCTMLVGDFDTVPTPDTFTFFLKNTCIIHSCDVLVGYYDDNFDAKGCGIISFVSRLCFIPTAD